MSTETVSAIGKTALVIHGGAGVMPRSDTTPEKQAEIEAALNHALDAGNAVLSKGGTARQAVISAIRALEDCPLFNAGFGSVYTAEGGHELDASVMDGHTRRAGAVSGVSTVKNPIRLAEAVMENSPHVMLSGAGAEAFADTQTQIERVQPAYYGTPHRLQQLHQTQQHERETASQDLKGQYFGTVGAVALDAHGHISAGTSTGGMTNKRWSRVGDSPIIGAGTYATELCGVSGTGWGEYFIRAAVAHDICARMHYKGDTLAQAAEAVLLQVVPDMGGDGGAIALDKDGNIAMPFNTEGMYRGWIRPDGSRGVAIFKP